MNTEKIKLTQVAVNKDNPRTITTEKFQKLVDSLLVFPKMLELRPIVIDRMLKALGGNMRLQALNYIAGLTIADIEQRLVNVKDFGNMAEDERNALLDFWEGWLEYPTATIARADQLTESEKKQFVVKDNVAYGQWDFEMLANQFDDSTLEAWGVDLMIDCSDDDPSNELEKVQNDDFTDKEEEEAKQANRTSPGDIWQLGEHRLICGDSTKVEDIRRLMGDEMADLWITDPPYNVAVKNSQGMTIENDNMSSAKFGMFLTSAFRASEAVMKKGCPFYVWFASCEHINFEQALNNNRLHVRQELVWNKNHFTLGRQDYQWKHEPCMYGWKDGAAHYFVNSRSNASVIQDEAELDIDKMTKAEMKELLHSIYDERAATTVINENKPVCDADHPTMKPIPLLAYPIKNSSAPNGVVMDLFGGSGSTLMACEQTDRICRTMELDNRYATVIVERFHTEYPDQEITVLRDGKTLTYAEVTAAGE